MIESGYTAQLLKRFDVFSPCDIIKETGAVAVTTKDLFGPISVLAIGFGLSVICFLVEKRFKRCREATM